MIRKRSWIGLSLIIVLLAGTAAAQSAPGMDELKTLMDSAWTVEANIFAPKTFEHAQDKYEQAQQAIERRKKPNQVANYVEEAREFVENSLKATEVAKLTLSEYLNPRERANKANAPEFVPELYQEAEEQFVKATEKVEEGNVRDGLKEAEKSIAMFDQAELEAIRIDVIGGADRLMAKALEDEAEKYAPATLDKSRTWRQRADSILTYDRYNRDEAVASAKRAQYEARHASNIAQSVRSLNRNDQAWEKLMLVYEIEMNRIGRAFGWDHLPFDRGPMAAADTVLVSVEKMQAQNAELERQQAELKEKMGSMITALGGAVSADEPVALAGELQTALDRQLEEKAEMASTLSEKDAKLADLSQEHQAVAAELEVRQEREAKLKKAKVILNPSEGEVLFNSANDIVLRLYGLSFDVGKADIKDEHIPLLEKVEEVVGMFPEAKMVIEGHTDTQGNAATNRQLSEKRAYAVMQFLRQNLLLSADRISAVGFGAERPVASNETKEGRAKNRRIDILIMQ